MIIKDTALGEVDVVCNNDEKSIRDAKLFIENLVANHKVYEGDDPVPANYTHRIVVIDGVRILKRTRFV